ncbi:MAG TPA: hypothetical protein VF666_07495 [Pyrinomonadaceae bacterium]|jgi:hypothetical protein
MKKMGMTRALILSLLLLATTAAAGCGGQSDDTAARTPTTNVTPPVINATPASTISSTPTPSATPSPTVCQSVVSSPQGSVPYDARACSPDKTRYAQEAEPRDMGNIAIYRLPSGEREKLVKVSQHPIPNSANKLKGLAWSADGSKLAALYHFDGGGHVSIIDVRQGNETSREPIAEQRPDMEFYVEQLRKKDRKW